MKHIIVCGDSHVGVFRFMNNKQKKYQFDVCHVGGATAQGMVNPNSKTNALSIFINKIKKSKKADKIIIMLGEVDCGFVIWVRSKRYNISVDKQIENSTENLFKFIEKIINNFSYRKEDIIVAGSVLPTIKDSINKKYLNGARSEVDVSQKIRTAKTLKYNEILKTYCKKNGHHYIDITKETLDTNNNTIKNNFINNNKNNHHLNNEKTYILWLNKLRSILL